MSTIKNILGKIIGLVLLAGIIFGLFVIVTVPFEMIQKAEAESWPSRKGIITISYASHKRGSGGRHGNSMYWDEEICGTYIDTGERFCVDRVRYGGFRFGEGETSARETVAKYPVGREIDVYYSPDDPEETVLEAISPWTEMYTLLGLAIIFLVIPVILWLFRKKIEPERYGQG